jgi:hyaluronan synthase
MPILDWYGVDSWRQLAPIGIAGAIVWALWLYRVLGSRFDRPVVNDFRTSTSVVVPSYREDPEILERCVHSWLRESPTEVIVVVDVDDHDCQQRLRAISEVDRRLKPLIFTHEGKRSALGVGIRLASGEVVVLADSDTLWAPGLLAAVQMPFADPTVGAVGTRQSVHQRTTSIWRRFADWMVNLRYFDYVPAMGRKGAVVCVSGRTAAYRRSVILPVLPHLEHEFFLGRRCNAGDDGRLTWLVLASGYRTVHQKSAHALSMFPDTFRAFVKQRVRWGRNSARCYLTALWKGWLWRVPFVSKITVLQILLTPVTMGLTLWYLLTRLEPTRQGVALAATWLILGRGIRSWSHIRRHPGELFLLPFYTVVVIFVALPVKLYAIFTMNRQGWLTRNARSLGGEAQAAATLVPEAVR